MTLFYFVPRQSETGELERLADWGDRGAIIESVSALGPGNVVLVELESEHVTELFAGFGEHGVKAEVVAKQAIEAMREYLVANVPVGPYLADQLLLPLGIAAWQAAQHNEPRSTSFRTMPLTDHTLTHIEVLKAFLGIQVTTESDRANATVTVQVGSKGN